MAWTWNTQSKALSGLALAMAFLVAIAGLALYNGAQWRANAASVNHTYAVLNEKDRLAAHLVNLQSSVRGYVISGDENSQAQVRSTITALNECAERLRTLVADNPDQLDRLQTLAGLIAKRASRAHEIMSLRQTQGYAPAAAIIASGEGLVTDQTQNVLTALEDEERRLLVLRSESTRRSGDHTVALVLMGCTLAIGVSALSGVSINRDLRMRHESERAIQRFADEINDLYHHAPCGYHSLDRNGVYVRINDTELAWLGYQRHEVENKLAFRNICAPESQARFQESFPKFLASGVANGLEFTLIRKDGSTFPVQLSATAVYDAHGDYLMSRSVMVDISDRAAAQRALTTTNADLERRIAERTAALREANESLGRSEKLFAEFMDNSPAYAWMKDTEGRYLYINRSHELRFGGRREDVIGKTDYDLWDLTTAQSLQTNDHTVLDAGRVVEFNEVVADAAGAETSLLAFKFPVVVPGASGAAEMLIAGMAVDITARRHAEEKALRLNRMYAMLSHTNAAIVHVRDRQALFQQLCEIAVKQGQFRMAWAGLLEPLSKTVSPVAHAGADREYVLATRISSENIPEGRGPTGRAVREGLCAVCADIQNDSNMTPWREHVDQIGYRSAAAIPLRFQGKVIGSFSVYADEPNFFTTDETDLLEEIGADISFALDAIEDEARRRDAEREVQRLNADLERRVADRTASLEAANQELEAFSYSVSHDLRAPLRSIDGFSLALLEDCSAALDEQGHDYLRRVRSATQHMGRLIDDLLGLSRVARREIKREEVNLSALAGDVVRTLAENDGARAIDLNIVDGLMDWADPHLMRVVFDNLLGNAWKFTSKNDHARIEFGRVPDSSPNTYFVRDNGAGFDPAYADQLFGAFQRLHSAHEFPGTGIGLATVRRVVRSHGGAIWAESAVGQGATFYFTLK